MGPAPQILLRLEHSYDAIPRVDGARAEDLGPLVLFVRQGPGWPYYARPRLGTTRVSAADVERVRTRQRDLALPEAFEWLHDVTPTMSAAAAAAGLSVLQAPLMVLEPGALPDPDTLAQAEISALDPDAPVFPRVYALGDAVARIAFAAEGPSGATPSAEGSSGGRPAGGDPAGVAGPAQRDALAAEIAADPAQGQRAAAAIRAGHRVQLLASTTAEGVLATGALQLAAGSAEVVGVATLPAARRRGLGAGVSAALARLALDRQAEIVFLSAAGEEVSRMYRRIGFRRVGTACIAGPPPG